jgi:hypothetical protein
MKKPLFIAFILPVIFLYCTHSTGLTEELKLNFLNHIKIVDSSLVLDSFKITNIDTLVQRLGRILDDSAYKRELRRVQGQLDNAIMEQKKDSIKFYQGEVNYMIPQIDSLTNSISKADTTKILGIRIKCLYQIRKNNKLSNDSLYYYLDNKMNIQNPYLIDSSILRTSKRLI